jgi:hypothetical protein
MPNIAPSSWSIGVMDDRGVRPLDKTSPDAPTALVWGTANALDAETWAMPDPYGFLPGAGLIVRSGWVEGATDEPRPLWMAGPREALSQFAESVEEQAASAKLMPVMLLTARDVLSDVPGLTSFFRVFAPRGWKALVAPSLLMTASMHVRAEEHLERIMDRCEGQEGVWAWLACDVHMEHGLPTPRPLRAGSAMSELLVRALQRQPVRRVVLVAEPMGGVTTQLSLLQT